MCSNPPAQAPPSSTRRLACAAQLLPVYRNTCGDRQIAKRLESGSLTAGVPERRGRAGIVGRCSACCCCRTSAAVGALPMNSRTAPAASPTHAPRKHPSALSRSPGGTDMVGFLLLQVLVCARARCVGKLAQGLKTVSMAPTKLNLCEGRGMHQHRQLPLNDRSMSGYTVASRAHMDRTAIIHERDAYRAPLRCLSGLTVGAPSAMACSSSYGPGVTQDSMHLLAPHCTSNSASHPPRTHLAHHLLRWLPHLQQPPHRAASAAAAASTLSFTHNVARASRLRSTAAANAASLLYSL